MAIVKGADGLIFTEDSYNSSINKVEVRQIKKKRKILPRNLGWSVFLLECADGTYYGGMTRDMIKEMSKINVLRKGYFKRYVGKVPAKIVFEDSNLPFREAFSKHSYLMEMNRRQRKKLIETKRWNNSWMLYRTGVRSIPSTKGQRQR